VVLQEGKGGAKKIVKESSLTVSAKALEVPKSKVPQKEAKQVVKAGGSSSIVAAVSILTSKVDEQSDEDDASSSVPSEDYDDPNDVYELPSNDESDSEESIQSRAQRKTPKASTSTWGRRSAGSQDSTAIVDKGGLHNSATRSVANYSTTKSRLHAFFKECIDRFRPEVSSILKRSGCFHVKFETLTVRNASEVPREQLDFVLVDEVQQPRSTIQRSWLDFLHVMTVTAFFARPAAAFSRSQFVELVFNVSRCHPCRILIFSMLVTCFVYYVVYK